MPWLRSLVDTLRWSRWPRWVVVGVCLALAAATAAAPEPSPAGTVRVVVAARPVAAGHRLTSRDVRAARWPPADVPAAGALARDQVIGRRAAGALLPGELLTTARVVGPGLTDGLPGGLTAVSVRAAGRHLADFLRPGDHADLYAALVDDGLTTTDRAHASPVVEDARVLAVLGADGASTEVVVALTRQAAGRLATADSSALFTLVAAPP